MDCTVTVLTAQPNLWMGIIFTCPEIPGDIQCQDYLEVGKTYTGVYSDGFFEVNF